MPSGTRLVTWEGRPEWQGTPSQSVLTAPRNAGGPLTGFGFLQRSQSGDIYVKCAEVISFGRANKKLIGGKVSRFVTSVLKASIPERQVPGNYVALGKLHFLSSPGSLAGQWRVNAYHCLEYLSGLL